MKNHQIEYIFPIPFPHRFFAQIQNSQNKHEEKFLFFLLFQCFFWYFFSLRAKKRTKERKKKQKSLAKLSANITLFIFLSRLNCLCGFIYSVSVFFLFFGVFFILFLECQIQKSILLCELNEHVSC